MAAEDDLTRAIKKIGNAREPVEIAFVFPDFDDGLVREVADALSEYNKACGGRGFELVELRRKKWAGGEIRLYALCPAIPEDET